MNLGETGPVPHGRSLRKAALKQVEPAFRLQLSTRERLAQRGQQLSWGIALLGLVAALMVPWDRIPVGPAQWQPSADGLNGALVGLWGVEATLFVLTAAITALLIGLFTEPTARTEVVSRYRRNAFDAAAFVALVALVYTGILIVAVLGTHSSKTGGLGHWVVAGGAVFVLDVGELAWLLLYTHQLLSEPPGSQILRWTLALRTLFLEEALARTSRALLAAWSAARDVAYEEFGSAPHQGRAALVAERSAYLRDVNMHRLDRWARRARNASGPQPARWQFWAQGLRPAANARRPSLRLYLNVRAVQGTRLAWVDSRSASTESSLNRSIVWTSQPPADPFPDALQQMRDRAVAAARDGQAGALEQVQDALESICEETMRIETGLTALPNPPPPRVFGWQPRTQLRIALQRMGADVLKSDSVFVVDQWLYFVQELLRVLRPYSGMGQEVMHLWAQAGARPDPPEQLMLRLKEYIGELNLAWREATSVEDVDRRRAEVLDFLRCVRNIWAYGPHSNRPQLTDVLNAAYDFVDALPAGIAPTPVDQRRIQSQSVIRTARRYFWLDAGVWLVLSAANGMVSSEEFRQLWEHDIAPSFQRPEQVWEAWGDYATADVIGWAQLRAMEEERTRDAAGQPRAAVGLDDAAVAAAPSLALMLRHADFTGMPSANDDRLRFQTYMGRAAEVLFGSTTVPWAQLQAHLPMAETASRFQDLRDAVLQ